MKVLLLSPPFKTDYMRNARCDFVSLSHTQWYPIILGSVGSLLEKHGHETLLIDAPAADLSVDRVRAMAQGFRPDVLVVYGGRMSESSDQQLADALTDSLNCRTVFCGPFVSIAPRRWLANTARVDAAVAGECELPLLEFTEGQDLGRIKNLVHRVDGGIVANDVRPYMDSTQLDGIPFVSKYFKKHVDVRRYRAISEPFPFVDIMSGRGCYWGQCSYCLWVHTYVKGRVYNARSIESLIGEFEYVSTWMPEIRSIMIQDDALPEDRIVGMSEAMIRHRIRLPWSCYARAHLGADTLQLMKRAGCLNLHVGFESADNGILKTARKGITMERMTRFATDAHRVGLRIHGDFVIGLEGETRASVMKTVGWARSLHVDSAQFQVIIPFEGTPLFDSLSHKGQLREGYPDYPELASEELQALSRMAYRSFYLRPRYLMSVLAHPRSRLWHYLKVAHKIIPNLFWKSDGQAPT